MISFFFGMLKVRVFVFVTFIKKIINRHKDEFTQMNYIYIFLS